MRGKEIAMQSDEIGVRITPACAGKRGAAYEQRISGVDHPRVCGEKTPVDEGDDQLPGSPPRVRGKAHFYTGEFEELRITPACAGKSTT